MTPPHDATTERRCSCGKPLSRGRRRRGDLRVLFDLHAHPRVSGRRIATP